MDFHLKNYQEVVKTLIYAEAETSTKNNSEVSASAQPQGSCKSDFLLQHGIDELKIAMSEENVKDVYDKLLSVPQGKYCVLYGCGTFGKAICHEMFKININVDFFCESDGGLNVGKTVNGIKCLSFTELNEIRDDVVVFISHGNARETYDFLLKHGFNDVRYAPITFQIIHYEIIKNIRFSDIEDDLMRLLEIFEDEHSAVVMLKLFVSWFKGNIVPDHLLHKYDPHQYFPKDIVTLSNNEFFVDAGAFNGDSVKSFINHAPKGNHTIYSFELDKANYDQLLKNTGDMPGVVAYNLGLSDSEGEIEYSSDGQNSNISTNKGTGSVAKLAKLDDILADKPVTFIKMDIEGAELDALHGAEQIIRKQKPVCAICVYHNPMHFLQVPLLLKQYVPEYKIYFRQHTETMLEAVCYATL